MFPIGRPRQSRWLWLSAAQTKKQIGEFHAERCRYPLKLCQRWDGLAALQLRDSGPRRACLAGEPLLAEPPLLAQDSYGGADSFGEKLRRQTIARWKGAGVG